MAMAERTTRNIYILYGNYGYGWDELCAYETRREAEADYEAYRENEPEYAHKPVKRRVKIA